MGDLGEKLNRLSWKPRYPIAFNVRGASAWAVDTAHSVHLHPELLEGFTVTAAPSSKVIADASEKKPVDLSELSKNIEELIEKGMLFLETSISRERETL